MTDAARDLAPRFRHHIEAMDSQIAAMETGAVRILHDDADVTAAALERARGARNDLHAIMDALEQAEA